MAIHRVFRTDKGGSTENRELRRTYTEYYIVEADPGTPFNDMRRHPSMPKPYEQHPDDPISYVDVVTPTRRNGRITDVQVDYDSKVELTKKQQDENPINRPAIITLDSEPERRQVTTDVDGKPHTTTAGEQILGRERTFTNFKLQVTKNVRNLPRWVLDYEDAINSEPIRIKGITWPKEKLKFGRLQLGPEILENGIEYNELRFELVFRRLGWNEPSLNFGKYETLPFERFNQETGKFEQVKELREILVGNPPAPTEQPVPLDEDGRAFRDADGKVKLQVDLKDIINNLVPFKESPVLPFSRLPLR